MKVQCSWRFVVSAGGSDLETEVDEIMRALVDLEEGDSGLSDSAIALDLGNDELEVTVTSECASIEDGIQHVMSAIRTAIHAAGGSTPDWPLTGLSDHVGRWSVRHGELVVS